MTIRDEAPGDVAAIRRVHLEAFGGGVEARIVELLRESGRSAVSLVAEVDGEVIGHVIYSAVVAADAEKEFRAVSLGPVGVRPAWQSQGHGSILIREGLRRCSAEGYHAVVLLGNPGYYARFGFQPAHRAGLENEWGVHDEFMVLTLREGALDLVRGMVRYAPEFQQAMDHDDTKRW